MAETGPQEVRLVLSFDDGATLSETIRLAGKDDDASASIEELKVSVAGTSDESDSLRNAERATFLEADRLLSASIGTETEDAIRAVLQELLPSQMAGSPTQQRKFQEFRKDAQRAEVTDALRSYCKVVESVLPAGSLGAAWGCTVMPSPRRLARVNVGRVETWSIDRAGNCLVYLQGRADAFDGAAHGVTESSTGPGFPRLEPNFTLNVTLDRLAELLNSPATRSAIERQITRSHEDRKRLMQPNWHNPLTETLMSS